MERFQTRRQGPSAVWPGRLGVPAPSCVAPGGAATGQGRRELVREALRTEQGGGAHKDYHGRGGGVGDQAGSIEEEPQ